VHLAPVNLGESGDVAFPLSFQRTVVHDFPFAQVDSRADISQAHGIRYGAAWCRISTIFATVSPPEALDQLPDEPAPTDEIRNAQSSPDVESWQLNRQ
jgi:hypothetical protein